MNKGINIGRVIWVTCIFLLLIIILVMVIDYKVNYQYLTNNKIYFYDCDGVICASNVVDDKLKLYSVYDCMSDSCPTYSSNSNYGYVLLNKGNDTFILYNYLDGIVIGDDYSGYNFIDNNYIVIIKDKKYGVMDKDGNIIVNTIYDGIGLYNDGIIDGFGSSNIIAKLKNKYGIISYKDGKVIEKFNYTEDKLDDLKVLVVS